MSKERLMLTVQKGIKMQFCLPIKSDKWFLAGMICGSLLTQIQIFAPNRCKLDDSRSRKLKSSRHGWQIESQNSPVWNWQDPNFAVQTQLEVPSCMPSSHLHITGDCCDLPQMLITWNLLRCNNKLGESWPYQIYKVTNKLQSSWFKQTIFEKNFKNFVDGKMEVNF